MKSNWNEASILKCKMRSESVLNMIFSIFLTYYFVQFMGGDIDFHIFRALSTN